MRVNQTGKERKVFEMLPTKEVFTQKAIIYLDGLVELVNTPCPEKSPGSFEESKAEHLAELNNLKADLLREFENGFNVREFDRILLEYTKAVIAVYNDSRAEVKGRTVRKINEHPPL